MSRKPRINKQAWAVNRRQQRRDYRNNSGCALVLLAGMSVVLGSFSVLAGGMMHLMGM